MSPLALPVDSAGTLDPNCHAPTSRGRSPRARRQGPTASSPLQFWALRLAPAGSPDHDAWAAALYGWLGEVARSYLAVRFPRADAWTREQVRTEVWGRWVSRAPSPVRPFTSDVEVEAYVCRSLHNQVVSILRMKARRKRILCERAIEVSAAIHRGADGGETFSDGELDPAALATALKVIESRIPTLLAGRRASRIVEVQRLFRERLATISGACSFDDLVVGLVADGMTPRTAGNRLRQRYHRAGRDLIDGLAAQHQDVTLHGSFDRELLTRVVESLFSDRPGRL